jgi:hypothetical protein
MIDDDRDPLLQSLFDDVELNLDGKAFSAVVIARTRARRVRVAAAGIFVAVVLLIGAAQFAASGHEFARLLAVGLATTLVDLGDTWLAWIFSPLNTVGSLIIVSAKAIRVGRKKIVSASYA